MPTGSFGTGASKAKAKLKKPKDLPKTPRESDRNTSWTYGVKPGAAYTPPITPKLATFDPAQQIRNFTNTVVPQQQASFAPYNAQTTPGPTDPGYDPGGYGALSNTAGASGYTPTAIASGYLNENPDVIAADVLAGMGITNPDVIGMLADMVDYALPMQLLTGAGVSGFAPSGAETVGFQQNFAQNMMTPGGSMSDIDDLMAAIMNADPNSALGQFLATQGPDGVNNLIQAAARMGTSNPYYTAGLEKQLDQMDLDYRRGMAQGTITDPDSYYQSVRTGPLSGYFG